MLEFIRSTEGIIVVYGLGYIDSTIGGYDLRVWNGSYKSGMSEFSGRFTTLEAAKAAAELIYSTRSQS